MRAVRQLLWRSGALSSSTGSRLQSTTSTASRARAQSVQTASDAGGRLVRVAAGPTEVAEEAWGQFVRSATFYTACDTAAVIIISQAGSTGVVLAGGLACAAAVARRSLTKVPQNSIAAWLLKGTRFEAGRVTVQLPAHISLSARVAAFLASSCLTGTVLAFPDLAHHSAARSGELEEVPLTGRQRPAMPVVSELERQCRGRAESVLQSSLKHIGPGAEYLPAHHPKSQRAQEVLQRLQVAAGALIVEHHGAESAVAQKYQQHFAGHGIPVKVFRCQETSVAGQANPAGIAVHEGLSATALASVLAHELAHMICRHGYEKVHNSINYTITAASWGVASVLLRSVGKGVPTITTCCLAVGLLVGHAWQLWAPPSEPQEQSTQPLLQPGQIGFYANKSLSRDICQELEAERVAMLIMARAGMDPAYVAAKRFPISPQADTKELVAHLTSHAGAGAASVSDIQPQERDNMGQGWPNRAKLALLYAEVLPEARAIYAKHRPLPFWKQWFTRPRLALRLNKEDWLPCWAAVQCSQLAGTICNATVPMISWVIAGGVAAVCGVLLSR